MATLVDDLGILLKTPALSQVADNMHESESSIVRGFQAACAAILGGLAGKSSEPGLLSRAFDMITGFSGDTSLIDGLGGFLKPGGLGDQARSAGSRFLSLLFGNQQAALTDKVGQAAGLRSESASKLLSFAAPFVMSWLGKRISDGHLNRDEFSQMVRREGASITSLLPSGIGSLLAPAAAAPAKAIPASQPSANRWLIPTALIAGALMLLGWALSRRPTTSTISQVAERINTTTSSAVRMVQTTLANGASLLIPAAGMENDLLAYLRNPPSAVDANRWFEFDRLNFNLNSTQLRPDSQEQLNNISSMLKAYPNVKVKIGCYTDNTGDPASNLTLSQQRAESVRAQLIALGIAPERLEAEGYGEQHPIADNSTEAGRARNRRAALRVTAF